MRKSTVERQKRSVILFIATAAIFTPLLLWLAWSSRAGWPAAGGALVVHATPARTVGLAQATPEDLSEAFAFRRIGFFPASDRIYVQRANAKDATGELLDDAGRWMGAVDFDAPDFSGDGADGLFPARRGAQGYGYVDGRGAWAIPAQFRAARPFRQGVAVAHAAGGAGLIDTHGRWLVPAQYKAITMIAPGWVVADDTWYVLDPSNAWKALTPTVSRITPFNDRLAIGVRDEQVMLVDRTGQPATPERYEQILSPVNGRAPARQRGKWGLIDTQGRWLITPQFEGLSVIDDGSLQAIVQGRVTRLRADGQPAPAVGYRIIGKASEGLTGACQALRCGYVDGSGQWVIQPQYEDASAFAEGVARVRQHGLLVYIDRGGRLLTPAPPAQAAAPWRWRPGAIRDANSNNGGMVFGYLDREGRLAIPAVFGRAGDFADNLAPVQSASGTFGYIDPDGQWAIAPVFRDAGPFSEGWAAVGGSRLLSANVVYIDAQGREQLALPLQAHSAGPFLDGKAVIRDWSDRPTVIDKTGKTLSDAAARAPTAPALQRLSVNGGKWGYADAQDRFVIAPQFDEAEEFSGDYAPVQIDGKWGYIDRTGKLVIRPAFDAAGPFSDGLARVRQDERWTYVDLKGQVITPDTFAMAADFHAGRARVGIDLETAQRRAAGLESAAADAKLPRYTSNGPPMIADGGDMRHGMTWIQLVSGGYDDHHGLALLNNKGQLVIPAASRQPPPASASGQR